MPDNELTGKALWISAEGLDGSGKTTMLDRIYKHLTNLNIPFRKVSMIPEGLLRKAFLTENQVTPFQELLLVRALHEQAYSEIQQALEDGYFVISDRGPDSFHAYQGRGSNLFDQIEKLNAISPPPLKPNATFYIDTPIEVCQQRMESRNEGKDTMESRNIDFHKRVQKGFQELIDEENEKLNYDLIRRSRFIVIDGTMSVNEVAMEARLQLDFLLECNFGVI